MATPNKMKPIEPDWAALERITDECKALAQTKKLTKAKFEELQKQAELACGDFPEYSESIMLYRPV